MRFTNSIKVAPEYTMKKQRKLNKEGDRNTIITLKGPIKFEKYWS